MSKHIVHPVFFSLSKAFIVIEEYTTSAGKCGGFFAAFSRPASACPSDRLTQGIFLSLKGVEAYEPEVHLPRLWDALGL